MCVCVCVCVCVCACVCVCVCVCVCYDQSRVRECLCVNSDNTFCALLCVGGYDNYEMWFLVIFTLYGHARLPQEAKLPRVG